MYFDTEKKAKKEKDLRALKQMTTVNQYTRNFNPARLQHQMGSPHPDELVYNGF